MFRASIALTRLAGAVVALASLSSAEGTVVTLTHNYSLLYSPTSLQIDTASDTGMLNWQAGDINHLKQKSYWYRLGETGGEHPLHSLGLASISQNAPNAATVSYAGGNGLTIAINYSLTGSATSNSFGSLLQESISITNTSGLPLHFFQYNDLDLGATPINMWMSFYSDTGAFQSNIDLEQNKSYIVQSSVAPGANYYQAGYFPELLTALSDEQATTLSNQSPDSPSIDSGDLSWAFQWDTSASSFTIASSMQLEMSGPPGQMPADVNSNGQYDQEDVRGFAFALTDPTGIFFLEEGGVVGNLFSVYDLVDRNEGVIDFDDLAAFAELIAPTFGSLGAAYAEIDGAMSQVPEPKAWLLLLIGMGAEVARRLGIGQGVISRKW
jgi:hypothetical protein